MRFGTRIDDGHDIFLYGRQGEGRGVDPFKCCLVSEEVVREQLTNMMFCSKLLVKDLQRRNQGQVLPIEF